MSFTATQQSRFSMPTTRNHPEPVAPPPVRGSCEKEANRKLESTRLTDSEIASNHLSVPRLIVPCEASVLPRPYSVVHTLGGWRTLLVSGCGFSRFLHHGNSFRVGHVFLLSSRLALVDFKNWSSAEEFFAQGRCKAGPLGLARVEGEAARAAASFESSRSRY